MRLQCRGLDADTTPVTMCVFCGTADTTNTAVSTVILTLVFVVQKDADGTPVSAEGDPASGTNLASVLYFLTSSTSDRLDGVTIHGMSLFLVFLVFAFRLVVAKATAEILSTTGGEEHGLPFVMYASCLGHLCLRYCGMV
jgi:hypothetical protein